MLSAKLNNCIWISSSARSCLFEIYEHIRAQFQDKISFYQTGYYLTVYVIKRSSIRIHLVFVIRDGTGCCIDEREIDDNVSELVRRDCTSIEFTISEGLIGTFCANICP